MSEVQGAGQRGGMDSTQALRRMVDMSGKPQRVISADAGKSAGFVQSYLATKRRPSADLLATIARACGYSLVLEGHGERIVIDGTRRDAGEAPGEG